MLAHAPTSNRDAGAAIVHIGIVTRSRIEAVAMTATPTHDSAPQQASLPSHPDGARVLLRHLVATLAYRASKVLRDCPPELAEHRMSPASRCPVEIVTHMGDLIDWAIGLANGVYVWKPAGSRGWQGDVERFFAALEVLDARLAAPEPLGFPAETMIQGPLADALTHVGQLALIRGAAGAAVRPESYARAEIVAGRVRLEQAAPGREFDGDASFPQSR